MTYIEIDDKLANKVKEITITDYEVKNGLIKLDLLICMVEDLLIEIENRDDRIEELENKDEYSNDDYDYWRDLGCLN